MYGHQEQAQNVISENGRRMSGTKALMQHLTTQEMPLIVKKLFDTLKAHIRPVIVFKL